MARVWRLIPRLEASGLIQMAIDEWLLEQHRLGKGLPCLRFYTWCPVAISLGYHQKQYPQHWHDLTWQGTTVELIRRPSGGRAVLHQGDLTYSLITSGHSGQRREVYRYLCQFLIQGWAELGISLQLGTDSRRYQSADNCFGMATAADLVMDDGYKVIGSAQLYRERCILQHGAIRLAPDSELTCKVFGTPITPPAELATIKPPAVIDALTRAAQQSFGIQFEIAPLSPQEIQQATAHFAPQ